jgi:hypothetical protein
VTSLLRGAMLARQAQPPTTRIGETKVWFHWGATWWEKGASGGKDVSDRMGGRELTMPVQAGTEGKLVMRVVAHVSPLVQIPGSERLLKTWCHWHVTVHPNGNLTIGNPLPSTAGDNDAKLQQGTPEGSGNRDTREFTLKQSYVAGTETTTIESPGIPVIGGSVSSSSTPPAATGAQSFLVRFDVQGNEGPHVEIGKVQVFQRQTHDVQFFRDKNTKVSQDERQKLMAWFSGLSRQTRRRLKAGTQKIKLETYASNTGPADKNQLIYANGRLNAVRTILGPNRFVAEEAWIATVFGEDKRPDDKDIGQAAPAEERHGHEKPDPKRVIAHLEVEDERTPGADDDDPFELLPQD